MTTSFKEFAELCRKVKNTSRRTEKTAIIAEFLRKLTPTEAEIAARLLVGRIFPEYSELTLDVGFSMIRNALANISPQALLFEEPVTIEEVYQILTKIAEAKGENSRRRKERLLTSLLSRLSEAEREYLIRSIFGEVRIGASEGLILEAIAKAVNTKLDTVRRAYMFLGDLGDVARIALEGGEDVLSRVTLTLFRPVKPMLAEMSYSIREVLREFGNIAAFEYKYDGVRVQIHKKKDLIRIFTRRLSEITQSLPDIIELVRRNVNADEVVLDGEVIGFKDGKPIRFQDLVKRVRRIRDVWKLIGKIPLELRLFDILYLNGKVLVDEPYERRWKLLESVVKDKNMLAKRIVTGSVEEAERFFEESISEGHEGLMAKCLKSKYTPGTRGKNWFKIKPADTIDVVIVAAEWGHGRRRGWLSDYYLAVRDENTGEYLVVGKTFKGLTDDEFREMTKKLLELKIAEEGYVVKVIPKIVVEVAYSEIQQSPKYKSGLALRFARIVRIRYDKSPEDITTLGELKKRYEMQFRYKAKVF